MPLTLYPLGVCLEWLDKMLRHNSVTINVLSRKVYSLQHAMSDIKGISTNHPFPLICLIIV
jgi:hypothetical protein